MLWFPDETDVPQPKVTPNILTLPIKLNVGGRIYQTTEASLRRDPQSYFAEMLDREWKRYLNGEIFIDRNSDIFELVLDYLRYGDEIVLPEDEFTLRRLRFEATFYRLSGLKTLIDGPFEFSNNSEHVIWFKMRDCEQFGCIRYNGLFRIVERKSYFMQMVNSHLEARVGLRKEQPIVIPEKKADVKGLERQQYVHAFKLFMNILKRGVAGSAASTEQGELCAPDLQVLCYLCRIAEYYQLHKMLIYLDALRPKAAVPDLSRQPQQLTSPGHIQTQTPYDNRSSILDNERNVNVKYANEQRLDNRRMRSRERDEYY